MNIYIASTFWLYLKLLRATNHCIAYRNTKELGAFWTGKRTGHLLLRDHWVTIWDCLG